MWLEWLPRVWCVWPALPARRPTNAPTVAATTSPAAAAAAATACAVRLQGVVRGACEHMGRQVRLAGLPRLQPVPVQGVVRRQRAVERRLPARKLRVQRV